MAQWYLSSVQYAAIAQWAAMTAYNVGDIRRQLAAPTVGNERAFRCTTAGTSLASEPSWTLTKGGTTTEIAGPVWTEVTGNSTYGWAAALARSARAGAWAASGDRIWMGSDHAETEAANITPIPTGLGIAATWVEFICVNVAGSVPPVSADLRNTATVSTTSSGSISFGGAFAYVQGCTYRPGTGGSAGQADITFASTSAWSYIFNDCAFELTSSSSVCRFNIGGAGSFAVGNSLDLQNVRIKFGATSNGIICQAPTKWTVGNVDATGLIPTTLFLANVAGVEARPYAELRGVDLSALGSGKNLISVAGTVPGRYLLVDCKTDPQVSFTTGSVAGPGTTVVDIINTDGADTNYRFFRQQYSGSIFSETTIVRTGGASDGTTLLSHKFVTTANAKFYLPLIMDFVPFWNEATGGALTAAVETVTDGVTLTDADAWIEVWYLGTSGFPLALVATDRAADILATGTNQTTSSETWTTTGLGSPVKQTLSVSFTPQEKGLYKVRVCVAKASTTAYVDLKIKSTSGRQYQTGFAYVNEGPVSAGSGTTAVVMA